MNQVYKNLALWMVIGLIVILLFTVFQGAQQGGQEQPNFSEFLKAVDQGRVDSVVIRGNHVTYSLKDSAQTLRTYIVEYPDLDRKSTRLNSSHGYISYAVFCLKKKKNKQHLLPGLHPTSPRPRRGHHGPVVHPGPAPPAPHTARQPSQLQRQPQPVADRRRSAA